MTEADWLKCEKLLPMLIFLRGDVPAEQHATPTTKIISGDYGDLFCGPGQRISAEQCRVFIHRCVERLAELPMDELSNEFVAAYRRYVLDGTDRDDLDRVCLRIYADMRSGRRSHQIDHLAAHMWTDDPVGAASAAMDIASTIANFKATDSVAKSCADATDDDWFLWGFSGGPPDPLWQETRAAEERAQASLLRAIVGNPFRTSEPI
jgi:hypothetical protein